MDILALLEVAKLIPTRSEGRRLIKQGGVLLNSEKVTDFKLLVTPTAFKDGRIVLKKGKKAFKQINLV
jgi:Tyrosyl-tRNA synthetase